MILGLRFPLTSRHFAAWMSAHDMLGWTTLEQDKWKSWLPLPRWMRGRRPREEHMESSQLHSPMLELADIARREEARAALGVSEVANASIRVAGGIASRGELRAWVNTAIGLGMAGPVSGDEIDRLIAWYAEHGIEPRVELCPYADPSLAAILASRGFVPHRFEQVFFREIDPAERFAAPNEPPAGLDVRVVDPDDEATTLEFARTVSTGFTPPGKPVREQDVALFARCVRHARTVAIGAWLDGRCVGGGALERLDDLAALYGLSVLSEYRGRGVQQALIAARLEHAARNGARLATIGGDPGMATERNVRRFGFHVAYTKMHLVRPGEGLVGMPR